MTRKCFVWYEVLAITVALGTAVDIFWSIVMVDKLYEQELNPIARWVICLGDKQCFFGLSLPHTGVALLCFTKVLATWIVLLICKYVILKHPRFGWPILASLALFQLGLAYFLCFHG